MGTTTASEAITTKTSLPRRRPWPWPIPQQELTAKWHVWKFKTFRPSYAIEQALMLGGDQSRALVGNDPSDFLADTNMEGGTKPLRLAL